MSSTSFSFRNEHLSFLSWDLLHSWGISEILKKKGSRTVFFASIKDDQTLVRLQEPFHILHRPSLIWTTWVFPKIRGASPKMDGDLIMENPIKMDDLGGFNPLFSETSTCTSWDPLNSFNFLSTLRHDLSVPWQWVNSVTQMGVQLHNLNSPRHPVTDHRNWEDMTESTPKPTYFILFYTEPEEVWLDVWVVLSNLSMMMNILQLSRCFKRTLYIFWEMLSAFVAQDAVAIWTRCWGGTTHKPWRVFSISCVNHQGSSIEIYGSFERFLRKEPGALFELAIFLAPDHQLWEWIGVVKANNSTGQRVSTMGFSHRRYWNRELFSRSDFY